MLPETPDILYLVLFSQPEMSEQLLDGALEVVAKGKLIVNRTSKECFNRGL